MDQIERRTFVQAAAATSLALTLPAAGQEKVASPPRAVGPLLGHVDCERAIVWFRAARAGEVVLRVFPREADGAAGKRTTRSFRATAKEEHDLCLTWSIDGLAAGQEYVAEVVPSAATGSDALPRCVIRTSPADDAPAQVKLAFGSCASSTKFFDVWDRIATAGADAIVLLGDTPYIDKTDLATNRAKHREFLSIPNLAELIRTRPLWATWDDHDFGANDSDGTIKNKDLIRQAFCEYRGLASYGDGEHGIYTKFRYGPVEVFLVDPRYFSQTEPSPVDATQKTCLGKTQWNWLLDGLAKSTAPFKILATGMIWDDKKNKEKDDWHTYAHEREALFDYIAEKKITGVLLIGGDIHVSRHLKYPLQDRLLHQCIVSPLHDRVLPVLNVPHPALVWGEPLPHVFLQLIADATKSPTTLTANWINRDGELLHTFSVTTKDLSS